MNEIIERKTFETLYGTSKDGKTKTWQLSVERYTNYSEIVTIYGFNRKIETRRRINSGKNLNKANATTHFEQAVLEASSKWKKKRDIEKYEPNTSDNELNNSLENLNIKEEKEDNSPVLPMLAQDYSKHKKKIKFPCFIQPKLDGYRMIFNTTTKSITTRQGKEFSIVKQSGILYKELCSLPGGMILDGELYVHNNSFETLGILRKTKNLTETDKQNLAKIEYHVYDIIDSKSPYHQRHTTLQTILKDNFQMIKLVQTIQVNSDEEIKTHHQHLVNEENYEGTMVRNKDGMYKEKYRSFDLLKFKDFMDSEFEIVDYTFEKDTSGADNNLIIWIIKVTDDILCKVRPKGTKEQRQQLYKECETNFTKFKGRKLWTKFFEYTSDGNLRFPTTKTTDISSYLRDEPI
jgi:ATP-dependent DNA ligase